MRLMIRIFCGVTESHDRWATAGTADVLGPPGLDPRGLDIGHFSDQGLCWQHVRRGQHPGTVLVHIRRGGGARGESSLSRLRREGHKVGHPWPAARGGGRSCQSPTWDDFLQPT